MGPAESVAGHSSFRKRAHSKEGHLSLNSGSLGGPGFSGLMIAGREGHKRKQQDKNSFVMRAQLNSTWNKEAGHWVWARAEGTFPSWGFVGGF